MDEKLLNLRNRLKKNMENELFMDQLDIECSCCCLSKPIEKFSHCEFNHYMCNDCICSYAKNMIYENGTYQIMCIDSSDKCNCVYSDYVLEKILDKKVFTQYLRLKTNDETKYIHSMKEINLIKCQFCETCWDNDIELKTLNCWECGKTTCLECNELEHKGRPCDKIRLKIEEDLTKRNFLVCANCSRCIEKTHGCNAVRCPCWNNMCWGCKKNWGSTDAHGCTCNR
jgi:hypothetical protein